MLLLTELGPVWTEYSKYVSPDGLSVNRVPPHFPEAGRQFVKLRLFARARMAC